MSYPDQRIGNSITIQILLLFSFIFLLQPVVAKGLYKTSGEFLQQTFSAEKIPEIQSIWLTGEIKKGVNKILGHPYPQLRVKYWRDNNRTAWILEEIGKERPITAGFSIVDGQLKKTEVLAFRESRGWEIRHPFFTRQFENARLDSDNNLTRTIDGITGATLSVSAMTRLSKMALYLHHHVTQ